MLDFIPRYTMPDGSFGTQDDLLNSISGDFFNQYYAKQQKEPEGISATSPMLNPFTSASAGQMSDGTPYNDGGMALQNYLNKQMQNASNSLYGGLMNYQPQAMAPGSANADYSYSVPAPQSDVNGLLGGFGARSWMQGQAPAVNTNTQGAEPIVNGLLSQPSMTKRANYNPNDPFKPMYDKRSDMPLAQQQMLAQAETDKQSAFNNLSAFAPEYFASLARNK